MVHVGVRCLNKLCNKKFANLETVFVVVVVVVVAVAVAVAAAVVVVVVVVVVVELYLSTRKSLHYKMLFQRAVNCNIYY